MKKSLRSTLTWIMAGFVLLFLLRLSYGYWRQPEGNDDRRDVSVQLGRQTDNFFFEQEVVQRSNDVPWSKSNYASAKLKVEGAPRTLDQKYEKVASVQTKSGEYDKDQERVRTLIKKFNALIQFEQNSGLKGKRRLYLAIGVHPDSFDEMTAEIQKIGKLASLNVDKVDKTNEYKDLEAKRVSLEKARNALLGLKGRSGKIEELINLENRILDIEKEIQTLGVKLGEYDQENEFCTVKVTLSEDRRAAVTIPFVHRAKVAFEWTVRFYFMLMGSFFCGSLGVLIVVAILEKLKWIPQAVGKHFD